MPRRHFCSFNRLLVKIIFTARQRSCGKVFFSLACVCSLGLGGVWLVPGLFWGVDMPGPWSLWGVLGWVCPGGRYTRGVGYTRGRGGYTRGLGVYQRGWVYQRVGWVYRRVGACIPEVWWVYQRVRVGMYTHWTWDLGYPPPHPQYQHLVTATMYGWQAGSTHPTGMFSCQ